LANRRVHPDRKLLGFFEEREQVAVALLFQILDRDEAESCRVDAVAEAGRGGAVGEDMAEVGVALGGAGLGANHAVGFVGDFLNIFFGERLGEAGPTGAGIEFIEGTEEGLFRNDADIDALAFVVPVFILEGGLRAALHGHMLLEFSEFGLGFVGVHGGEWKKGGEGEEEGFHDSESAFGGPRISRKAMASRKP
jgi:hypothetical protein